MIHPTGVKGFFTQRDTQSYRTLERETRNLCNDLRSKNIDFEDALFRFKQEVYLYDREAGTDNAKALFQILRDFFM